MSEHEPPDPDASWIRRTWHFLAHEVSGGLFLKAIERPLEYAFGGLAAYVMARGGKLFGGAAMSDYAYAALSVAVVMMWGWMWVRIVKRNFAERETAQEKSLPLGSFLDVRLWVEPADYSRRPDPTAQGALIKAGHRAIYRRGPSGNMISLRCGIEVASRGKQRYHLKYIRDLKIEINWPGGSAILHNDRTRKPMVLDYPTEMSGLTTYTHIHTVDEPDIEPNGSHVEPQLSKRFGTVHVTGTVVLEGDKRSLSIDATAPIPFEIGSTPDFGKAVESIRAKLRHAGHRRAYLVDLDLRHTAYDLFWHWAAQSSAKVPDRSEDNAYKDTMLDEVAALIMDDIGEHEPALKEPTE